MKQKHMKKLGSFLLAGAMALTMFPTFHTEVHAAGNQLPTKEQFATAEELKTFDTNDQDGKNPAKVYFGNNSQKWWIAGSQEGNLTLFAESPLATSQLFEPNKDQNKAYSADWNCDYTSTGGSNPSDVYPNHYGASPLRTTLKGLESSYFTSKEQDLMKNTTVYTNDTKNSSVYSTTNKLYLAYGDSDDDDQYVTVGKNASDNLNNGLRIDKDYWGGSYFWLRAPDESYNYTALVAVPGYSVGISGVYNTNALVPAFELNLSSVIFASAAPAASSDGQLSENDAFTLRHKSQADIGTATISQSKGSIAVTDVTNENTYLVVQNSNGAWAKKVSSNDLVFAGDMDSSLTSFENCKIWLETTSDRITYAEEATQGSGHNVKANVGDNLTVTGGNILQTNVSGNITEITIKVNDGYYLPDDYISNLQGQLNNGLSVTQKDNGFTIYGTPTSDVNIMLPAATVLPKADTPEVAISKTKASITATVTNHKNDFGDIEYKWNDGNWEQDKNTLSNLQAETTYKLAVRFTGNGFYQMSDEYSVEITTLKDGNTVIVVPAKLTTTYKEGLKLSEVALPSDSGWSWKNGDTSLSAGTESYPATFDTTNLESTTDFSGVEGYDETTHKVTRNVEVEVEKADSSVSITTQSLDKAYDGNVVIAPEYTTSGSNGKVTITWQKNTGSVDTPQWEDLKSAPSIVGTYRAVVELAGNDNYNSAAATLDFVISKAQNTWTEELSITGWVYNEKVSSPTAKAQFGDVTFTYSSEENGTYTSEVPKNAGTYYVKATVAGTENYTGLESAPVAFEIAKAIPTYEKVTGLVLGQGQPLSKIELPEQFKWVDETIIADELGTHTFKAVYTPEDTANYQTIEVEIEVEAVPTPVELNHVPTISASDKTITVGDKFEPLKDVTATDEEDGDLTSQIKVINNTVNTKKAGTYEVTYQVTDSQGAAVTKTIKVTVEAKSTPVNPDKDKPDNDKDNGSVETGDRNNLLLWEMMLIGSSIILIYSLYRKKRKTNQ